MKFPASDIYRINVRTMKNPHYFYESSAGIFFITWNGKYWSIIFDDENLGSYGTPEQALDDLVGGHAFTPSSMVDTSILNIPDEINEWEKRL